MSEALAAKLESSRISYFVGVVLVLMSGVFWSSMGLGIRLIEQANVWQILFYRSIALACFLFCIITLRSGFRPLAAIRSAGIAGAIGGVGLVLIAAGVIVYLRLQKKDSEVSQPRKRKRQRKTASGHQEEVDASPVYCHICGDEAGASDHYCRRCGAELRH